MSQIPSRCRALTLFAGISSLSLSLLGSCGGGSPLTGMVQDPSLLSTGTSLSVAANGHPIINDLDGDSVIYTIGGPPVNLDPDTQATVTDTDSTDFDGGTLTVTGDSNDDFLAPIAGPNISFSFAGSNVGVLVNGTLIGTRPGRGMGTGTGFFLINLNANATPALVNVVLQNFGYQATGGGAGQRTIDFVLTDGDSGTSNTATVTVSVVMPPPSVQVLATGLKRPYNVAIDDNGTSGDPTDDVYVVAEFGNSVGSAGLRLVPANGGSSSFVSLGSHRPYAVGVESPGVYIIADNTSTVSRVQNGVATPISTPGQAYDIEIEGNGTATLVNLFGSTVEQIDLTSGGVSTVATLPSNPIGYSPDPLSTGFFATLFNDGSVLGTASGTLALNGSIGSPVGIDTDGSVLYVSDRLGNVWEVDPDTGDVTLVTNDALGEPFGMTVKSDGNLLITDFSGRLLEIVNP